MFWKRNDKDQKGAKLSGPKDIPEIIKKYMAANPIVDAGSVPFLKMVVKGSEKGEKVNDVLIFDPSDAEAREIKVQNFDSLKENPDMIMAEGWFDESAKKYSVYGVCVVNMQPTSKENKIFESDKPAEIAKWISDSHKPRFC
jgi:hypothetical protein